MLLYLLLQAVPEPVATFDLLKAMWEVSPILAVLLVAIGWLVKKNEKLHDALYDPEKGIIAIKDGQIRAIAEKKEAQIQELNDYIRTNDKENLEVLTALDATMDKLIDNIDTTNAALRDKIISEASMVKSHIDTKIAELRGKIGK